MALFVFIGHDGPEGTARREQYRAAHVAALDKLDAEGRIAFAGPIRDDANAASTGAVIVFDADSLDAAKKLMAHDPYVVGGVFANYSIHPFRQAYPK
ncbi:MAG: YciI family protein [bacterium]